MTDRDACGCDDCECGPPIFLEGGDKLAVQLRELAFGLLMATKTPIEPIRLVELTAADEARVRSTLDVLAGAGRIDRDDRGRVLGAAGMTLADGPHGLEIDGSSFRTWCAFDAIGIPAALAVDARIETACGVCSRPIAVDVRAGRPRSDPSVQLWLSGGGTDMRADFCDPTVLLCSQAHAAEWAARNAGRGTVLSLTEAADEGARNWASVATAAKRLLDPGAMQSDALTQRPVKGSEEIHDPRPDPASGVRLP
jgi:alkylmercury lyase